MKSFLRGWVIPPKITEAYCRMKWGPLGVPGQKVEPERASPATLDDLRSAVTGDIVWARLEKIRTAAAQALTAQQHHYLRYFEGGWVSLKDYFSRHQPRNSAQLVFSQGARDGVGKVSTAIGVQQPMRLAPWLSAAILPGESQWEGPSDERKLLLEARRLDRAKVSLEKYGMWMALKNPEPSYYLLVDDKSSDVEDYRVIINGGNHRVAFLAHCGWPLIPMSPGAHLEVSLSTLDQWPGVLDESFTRDEARNFFMAFFRDPHENLLPNWR